MLSDPDETDGGSLVSSEARHSSHSAAMEDVSDIMLAMGSVPQGSHTLHP